MSESGYRPPLSYKDPNFLDRSEARSVRILSEYLQPLSVLRKQQVKDTIVFFGSARIEEDGPMGRYYREARGIGPFGDTLVGMVCPMKRAASSSPRAVGQASWKRLIAGRWMPVASPSASISRCPLSRIPTRHQP